MLMKGGRTEATGQMSSRPEGWCRGTTVTGWHSVDDAADTKGGATAGGARHRPPSTYSDATASQIKSRNLGPDEAAEGEERVQRSPSPQHR